MTKSNAALISALTALERRVALLECRQQQRTTQPCNLHFPKGARVAYAHIDSRRADPLWTGVVIPRPYDCAISGKEGPLVWVMKDNEPRNVVGCYPWNLEKL
jgi:hypothetical protein